MYTVAELVADVLEKIGVARVYGVIGTTVLDFIDVLYERRDRLPYITTRHEQAAVSMADAEARVSARPGVALVHAGPGLLNAMLGLGIAHRDRSRVLLLVGNVPRRLRGTEAWLEADVESSAKSVSKSYHYVGSGSEAAEELVEAVKSLFSPPGGPVVIEVPQDVWREPVQVPAGFWEELSEAAKQAPIEPSRENVADLLARLTDSEKPLIIVGGEAAYSPLFSQSLLLELAERLDAYIAVTGNGRGGCPEDHPRCLGRIGFGSGNIVADKAFEESDTVLVLGGELDDMHTYGYSLRSSGDIYVVSLDPAVEKRPLPYTELVKADPAATLRHLASTAEEMGLKREHRSWAKRIAELKSMWRAMVEEALSRKYEGAVNPARLVKAVDKALPRNRIVAAGQGVHIVYAYDFLAVYEPRSFLAATQLGSMSFALPAAVAASLAKPGAHVVAVVGDGELMMTVQELETLKRVGAKTKILLLNDNAYRVLYLRQVIQKQGRVYGSLLENPDFPKLAEAFGIKGLRVRSDHEIAQAVKAFIESPEPVLLEAIVPRDDMPPMNLEYALKMQT